MTEPWGAPRERMPPIRPANGYILIAMPSVNRAAFFKAVATTTGFEVIVVRDGEEARQEFIRRGTPALLILDPSLPKVDGFELLRELRQLGTRIDASVIVVSGHAAIRAAARRLAESLGISNILPFDVDRAALRDAVDAAIGELGTPQGRTAIVTAPAERRPEGLPPAEDAIDTAITATARRFRGAVTAAYVKVGQQEYLRGYFAVSDPSTVINLSNSLTLLRQVAQTTDTLIVPNVINYPALADLVPGGLAQIRGFVATPLMAQPSEISGALCVMETKQLELEASDIDVLEGIARDLIRDLGGPINGGNAGQQPSTTPSAVDIDSLERLASADPLTGLANRRGGEKDIAAEISRARRQNSALSCVLLDIDHFKDVNDTFGHQAGDYVLREVSALLRRTVRAYDILVRWGGEEFLVVLPGVEQEQALKLAERIRAAIENLPLAGIGGVTASVGVSSLGSDYSFEAMFAAADRRLYSAKSSGRNTVA